MDIKTTQSFIDQDRKLDKDNDRIRAGRTFTGVDKQYAEALIQNGLATAQSGQAAAEKAAAEKAAAEKAAAEKAEGKTKPASTKPAAPAETK